MNVNVVAKNSVSANAEKVNKHLFATQVEITFSQFITSYFWKDTDC